MLNEDQYMERTPDLVAKIHKMREVAEKEMNRFTRVDDYDVRRVVGQKPLNATSSVETTKDSTARKRPAKPSPQSTTTQTVIEFSSAAAAQIDDGEQA